MLGKQPLKPDRADVGPRQDEEKLVKPTQVKPLFSLPSLTLPLEITCEQFIMITTPTVCTAYITLSLFCTSIKCLPINYNSPSAGSKTGFPEEISLLLPNDPQTQGNFIMTNISYELGHKRPSWLSTG
jgi:hypothetical protein